MRLIDADTLKEHKYYSNEDGTPVEKISAWKQGWNDAIDAIADYASTVDPMKHGHWVEQECCDWVYSKECRCSECGKYRLMTNPFGREWNYCPNCGAKMDGVETK